LIDTHSRFFFINGNPMDIRGANKLNSVTVRGGEKRAPSVFLRRRAVPLTHTVVTTMDCHSSFNPTAFHKIRTQDSNSRRTVYTKNSKNQLGRIEEN
jgi:hypothetical protein